MVNKVGSQVVLASNNSGKFGELAPVLESYGIELLPQSEVCQGAAEENGVTFVENALLKARYVAERSGLPVIADDSGLAVDFLAGEPGVRSARYADAHGDDRANNHKLLDALDGVPETGRGASFHCALVFLRSAKDPVPIIATGSWSGKIAKEPSGAGGFGYDPLFYLSDLECTAAELAPEQKRRISHRGQAVESLVEQIKLIAK